MKVLLTGNLGYVGTVVGPYLQERGHGVTGLDLGYYQEAFIEAPLSIETLPLDIRTTTPKDLEGFDAVVHLAGLSNDPLGELDPTLTDRVNRQGTRHLAEMAKLAGVSRFIFASSCSLYGKGERDNLDETSDFNPQTAYARSKIDAEGSLVSLANTNFSPTFLRFATAFGYSPRLRLDLVVNNLVACAMARGKIQIMSDGSPWRPLIHVRDMAQAIAEVLEADRTTIHARAFNAGSNQANYQVKDIAQLVQKNFPESQVTLNPDASPDTRSYRVDFSKINRNLPNFKVQWTLERGIEDLRENLTRLGMDEDKFQHRYFTRLKQLQYLLQTNQLNRDLQWVV